MAWRSPEHEWCRSLAAASRLVLGSAPLISSLPPRRSIGLQENCSCDGHVGSSEPELGKQELGRGAGAASHADEGAPQGCAWFRCFFPPGKCCSRQGKAGKGPAFGPVPPALVQPVLPMAPGAWGSFRKHFRVVAKLRSQCPPEGAFFSLQKQHEILLWRYCQYPFHI